MSIDCQPSLDLEFPRGEVRAVLRRRKAHSVEGYHDRLRPGEWEVVLPEFAFTARSK